MKVWTASFGFVNFDTNSDLYNGFTVEQIESRLQGWHQSDAKRYVDNCKEVIRLQLNGNDAGLCECIKQSNFWIAKQYN